MYYGNMGGVAWLWGLGMLVVFIAGVALIAWVVVTLSRGNHVGSTGPAQPPPPPRPEALEILRERFARGEISAEEFETSKRVLGYGP